MKRNSIRFFLLFVFFVSSLPAAKAAVQNFTVGEDHFSVDVPAGWQTPKDLMGIPISLIGPENKNNQRTVIAITPSGTADTESVFEKGDKDIKPYIEGREAWLKKYEGKSLSYDPYHKTSWSGIEEAHVLGYHYELPTGKFYERAFYVLCGGKRFYHIKTLTFSDYEKTDNDLVDQTIKTIQCQKVAASSKKASRKVK